MFMDPMEEQNHFVNDSEMGNPSILSVLIYFANSYFNVYFALYVFMIEWRINKQTNNHMCIGQYMGKHSVSTLQWGLVLFRTTRFRK